MVKDKSSVVLLFSLPLSLPQVCPFSLFFIKFLLLCPLFSLSFFLKSPHSCKKSKAGAFSKPLGVRGQRGWGGVCR